MNKDQHDPVVLTEVERTELRELRLRNTEQRDLLKSVILEVWSGLNESMCILACHL